MKISNKDSWYRSKLINDVIEKSGIVEKPYTCDKCGLKYALLKYHKCLDNH